MCRSANFGGLLALLLIAAGVVVSAVSVAAAAAADFRHGIGVGAMAWAAIEPGPARAFVFPPFADRDHALRRAELRTLRRTGFDSVRLAVDPGPFLQFQGLRRDEADRVLLDRVKEISAAGLAVIVDFHPSDMHPDYTAAALTAGVNTPLFHSYLRLIERTAALLGGLHSDTVALELMNEPPVSQQAWQPMLDAAYAAARRGASALTLVVEGGNEASVSALMQMDTRPFAKDRAVLFAFHYYEPYQFTHQGASWNPARYLADVPYPARARPLQDSLDATAAAIAATKLSSPQKLLALMDAKVRLQSYWWTAFDASTIAKSFDQIAAWAHAHGLPPQRVLLGEFGARETELQLIGTRAAERARWFRDVRDQAEVHGFGWNVWAYRGNGGFALVAGENSNEIQPGVAQALGLRSGLVHARSERFPQIAARLPPRCAKGAPRHPPATGC